MMLEWRTTGETFARNPDGSIDLEVNHPELGWIAFTALENDPEGGDIYAAVVASGAELPPVPVVTDADRLTTERRAMRAYKRSMFIALTLFPAPGFAHLLARLMAVVKDARDLDPFALIALAADTVTIYERNHPDMVTFAASMGLSQKQLDTIFRTAIAIERGAPQNEIVAAAAQF